MSKSTKPDQFTNEESLVMNSGSWGATLGIFYLIGMRAWVWLLIGILIWAISPFLIGLPSLFLFIYLIVRGKRIAWKTRKWKNFDEFLSVQRAWDLWGKILLGFQIVGFFGLLSAVVILNVGSARSKANDVKIKNDVNTISMSISLYKAENNKCPNSLDDLIPKYLTSMPTNSKGKTYEYEISGDQCVVSVQLDNANDKDLQTDFNPANGSMYDKADAQFLLN